MGEGEAIPLAASSFSQFPSSHHSVRPISSPALRGPVRHSRTTQLRMVKQVMLPTQKEIRCTLQKSIAGQAFGILLLLMLLLVILLLVLYPPLPHSPPRPPPLPPPVLAPTPVPPGRFPTVLLLLLLFVFGPSPGVRPHRYKPDTSDGLCLPLLRPWQLATLT